MNSVNQEKKGRIPQSYVLSRERGGKVYRLLLMKNAKSFQRPHGCARWVTHSEIRTEVMEGSSALPTMVTKTQKE
jgi:hypothetical protein